MIMKKNEKELKDSIVLRPFDQMTFGHMVFGQAVFDQTVFDQLVFEQTESVKQFSAKKN